MTEETSIEPIEASGPDTTQLLLNERARVKSIMQICQLAKCTDNLEQFIEEGTTIDEARQCLFEKMAASSDDIINTIPEKQQNNNQLMQAMISGLGGR